MINEAQHEIDRRAFRHDMVDGLTEIAMSLFFLVPAITLRNPAFSWMIIIPILVFGPVIRKIRARSTYPRIGYVEPRGEKPAELFRGIAVYALVVASVVAVGAVPVAGATHSRACPAGISVVCVTALRWWSALCGGSIRSPSVLCTVCDFGGHRGSSGLHKGVRALSQPSALPSGDGGDSLLLRAGNVSPFHQDTPDAGSAGGHKCRLRMEKRTTRFVD